MGSETILFYLFAAVAVAGSLLVIGQRNPIYSVLFLIGSFGALSGLYVLLDAAFVAVIQIIVYAGAIMVLFLFVVMLLNAPYEEGDAAKAGWEPAACNEGRAERGPGEKAVRQRPGSLRFGAVLAVALTVELWWALNRAGETGAFGSASVDSVAAIGRLLFSTYAFPFEVTSVLILVAMIGAVVLARRDIPSAGGPSVLSSVKEARGDATVSASGAGDPASGEKEGR